MRKHLLTIGALSTALTIHGAQGQATTNHTFREVSLDSGKGSAPAQLAAAAKQAKQEGLTPVLDVGAPWCGPCHTVDAVLHGTSMEAVMKKLYVIHANLDVWQTPLAQMGADVNTGIPRVFALDQTGRPSGEPWRPRDIPDSLQQKGDAEAIRISLIEYFKKTQTVFAQPIAEAKH